MLGKTADGLYWMYRYLERAENTSRLIETGQRIALTGLGDSDEEWMSVLRTAGMAESYGARHDTVAKDTVVDWMLRADENPSSVRSAIRSARQNARVVRTALTIDVWEAVNGCHMMAGEALARKVGERDLPGLLKTIRQRTALVRGATDGTMLRNDIYDFCRLGTFLERADNTARLLDVKYFVLLPSIASVGSNIDNVQWEIILRAVSARGGYNMEYGGVVTPRDIARFLILDRRMPRSLAFCVGKLWDNLGYLRPPNGEELPSYTMARQLVENHLSDDIEVIFDRGLHEFLQKILKSLAELGKQIEIDYRFYE